MKIQKHISRKSKNGKSYYKYEVIIPPKIIKKAGFKEGDELDAEVKRGKVMLRKEK